MPPLTQEGLHLHCLPAAQRLLWPRLSEVPSDFILYGGTALALHLGHRTSVDFDFFCGRPFDTDALRESLEILRDATIDNEEDSGVYATLPDGKVKISFVGDWLPCRHPAGDAVKADNGVRVASIPDVFGSKCKAIQERAKHRDYVDICAILERTDYTLADGLSFAASIHPGRFNPALTLSALDCHEDLDAPPSKGQIALLQDAIHSVGEGSLPERPPRDRGRGR